MHLHTLLIVFLLSLANGQDRQLISKLNPGCLNCDSSDTLVYLRAEGVKDTIHQIWDFTRGVPSVIYAVGSVNSSMTMEWNRRQPVNFTFVGQVTYSFAAAIDKLYEYEDCKDVGHIDDKCPRRALPLRDVEWTLNTSILTSKEVMIKMHGFYKNHRRSGLIHMKLDMLPFTGYAVDLPHLIHTANSSLVDISLVNFTTTMNASRYAIHFVMVSTDNWDDTMNYTMRKSLDDEHTPGVFEIIEIRTPKSQASGAGGFMQFRPVSYTEKERSVSSSTNAYISPITRISLPSNVTTLGRFYKDNSPINLLAQQMFISFGLPGDGYYKQRNFSSWSFTFGYGSPPVESVSLFVIIIISIGMGVPVLLALSGVTYVLVRRYRQRRNPPERFIDDE